MEICRCEFYYNLIKDEHFYVLGTYYHPKVTPTLAEEGGVLDNDVQKELSETKSITKEEKCDSLGEEKLPSKWIPVSGIVSQKLINAQRSEIVIAPYA